VRKTIKTTTGGSLPRNRIAMLSALVLCFESCSCGWKNSGQPHSSGIQPAALIWRTDINSPDGPGHLLEAITRIKIDGRDAWRVTHYDLDPTATSTNDFDLYDIDASSLKPIRSVMQNGDFHLEIVFDQKLATFHKVDKDGSVLEKIPLSTDIMPEGPGHTALVASLPLREGFVTRYYILDRWAGTGPSRIKEVILSVNRRLSLATEMGTKDAFEVESRAADGSFRIVEYDRTRPPFYPFRLEYTRDSKTSVSDVVSILVQEDK
jgi:hypothetical protein